MNKQNVGRGWDEIEAMVSEDQADYGVESDDEEALEAKVEAHMSKRNRKVAQGKAHKASREAMRNA